MSRLTWATLLLLLLNLASSRKAAAYSLLTHQQLIDLTWTDSIVPLLKSRYPALTTQQLDEARAYAYGGCVIQDIGYYPFGDLMFSNLTHYVRTGDFVVSLFRNAHNADELAFAIGALSHYVGDSVGHSEATNLAVPIDFPRLAAKYGKVVNYAEGEHQHVQTEFGFDIDEIAHHHFAPLGYLRKIGLRVPLGQLAAAFYETYGLTEDFSANRKRRFNVRGYRFATRTLIPRIAYAVTLLHRRREPADSTSPERVELANEVAAVEQENDWAAYRHRRPPFSTYAVAAFIFIVPKIGPLKMTAVRDPNQETGADYIHSVVTSTAILRAMLAHFTPPANRSSAVAALAPSSSSLRPSRDPRHPLPNRDLDTGQVVKPGGYPLTDATYAQLLHSLTRDPARSIPPGIKQDVLNYYSDPNLHISTQDDPARWKVVQADLAVLSAMKTTQELPAFATYSDDANGNE